MKTITFYHPDMDETITRSIYEYQEFPLQSYDESKVSVKKKYNKEINQTERIAYIPEFLTFDIETTTIITEEYKKWKKGELSECNNPPYAFMYIWQCCNGEHVCMGRYWSEFLALLERCREFYKLNRKKRMVVYVHFLSYEFQFIYGFLQVTDLFAKDIRKPLSFLANDCFEFRCSYFLSNMSLRKFCENSKLCVHWKLKDEFEYSIRRTAETVLSDVELGYCYCDVKGLHECVETRLLDDTLATIPLTSTGYVRRDVRRSMAKNRKNYFLFQEMRLNLKQYELLEWLFRGGDTHASRFYAGMVLHDLASFDFKSSYPFVMLVDYFPMSRFYNYFNNEDNIGDLKFRYDDYKKDKRLMHLYHTHCVIAKYEFRNIRLKEDTCSTYIDVGHIKRYSNLREDNGRLLAGDYIEYPMTEIDFKIVSDTYVWDEMIISSIYYAKRGGLPEEYKTVVRKYFQKKTAYDGISEKKYEYAKSKNDLNALFGMLVSALIHSLITCEKGNWKEEKPTSEEKEEQLEKYYKNKGSFLPYQWGVYVTAHARARLNYLRSRCEQIDRDSPAYWDTDSLKCRLKEAFLKVIEEYNKGVRSLNESAKGPDGRKVYLGVFERERGYRRFKTLGAKKYAVEYDDGTFQITVAGLSKEHGAKALLSMAKKKNCDVFELFDIGTVIEDSKHQTAIYNDEPTIHEICVDGVKMETAGSVALLDTSYEFGVTGEYYELILQNLGGIVK